MRAVIAHALIAWSLPAAGTFTKLALVSEGAIRLVYIGCCAAAWRLQRTDAGGTTAPFRLAGGPLIRAIGVLGLVFLLNYPAALGMACDRLRRHGGERALRVGTPYHQGITIGRGYFGGVAPGGAAPGMGCGSAPIGG